ncbi:class A beta-lactamase-related serine hydrolase [Robiginitalea sp. SC105]|uniref:class A beta-lactamase-related serine hydrolase n=1 Tax=Robiginitalea sp. SC105 TaxID=2762332 RepID=UPI002107C7D7|nr:class A beta-lactamase-related serine hydrolase [Robiginitalea sp. SC105]
MKKFASLTIPAALLLCLGCSEAGPDADPLEKILSAGDPAIVRVMENPELYELQIRYTRIFREGDSVRFEVHDFRVDPGQYHYPASTVKFPIAVLALEKLGRIDSIDRDTRYYVEGDTLEDSFAGDIRAVFAISDNHANNRLFEFLGQDAINRGLASRNIGPARISHRLGYHRDDTTTRPLVLYRNDSVTAQTLPIENNPIHRLELNGIRKGTGYMSGDSLIGKPFDFSLKNYLPLPSLDGILKRVIFPEAFPADQRFDLSPDQRTFLLEAMSRLPREAGYDPELFPDGYCKFFMYGDTEERIPESVRIFNKVGFAYGTLTDCAYITDRENGVEFLLAATLLVNENGIFNDDQYEYDEVGIPFLAALGRAVHQYEIQAKK